LRHDALEYLGAIDQRANTVVTAVDCGPVTRYEDKGIVGKAKSLAGRLGRVTLHHDGGNMVGRVPGGSGEEVETQRVIVSYDVSRTVEEKFTTGS
jgi:hypothetical protein